MNEEELHKEGNTPNKIYIDPKLGEKIIAPTKPEISDSEVALKQYFKNVCFDSSVNLYLLNKDRKEKTKYYKNTFCFNYSIHTAIKQIFISEIDTYLKKTNYKRAIGAYEEMFESVSIITRTDLNNYNKIINIHNKLNPKKAITAVNYEVTQIEEHFKSAFSKINATQIIDIPRGYNSSKYEGYSLSDLHKKTDRITTTSNYFEFANSKYNLFINKEIKAIPIDLYRIVKDPFSDLFIIRTKSKKAIIINDELQEISAFDAKNIFISDNNWNNSINISKNCNTILLTENEEVHLYNLSFKEKSIWVLPSNTTEGKFKDGNNLDTETELHLKTLEIEGIPTKQEVKVAYKTLALKHHPDKNPENIIQADDKMKKLNAAKDYLENIDFNTLKNGNSNFPYRIIAQVTSFRILTPYEPNIVCASFIDKQNFIYLACKSGNIYILSLTGILVKTIDFATNNKYFYSFDSMSIVNQTLIICEGEYIHLFKNDKHFKTIRKTEMERSKIKYLENHFILLNTQSVVIYDSEGNIVDILLFNRQVRSIYNDHKNIIIEIPGKFIVFALNK